MKTLLMKVDPRVVYLLITLGALAAAAGAPTGPSNFSMP